MRSPNVLLCCAFISLAQASHAAKPPAAIVPNALTDIIKCRNIASETERLSCYDSAAKALDVAVAHHDIAVLDKEDVHRTRRTLFGLSMPNLSALGIGNKEEEARAPDLLTLDTTVRSVRPVGYGKWEIETAENAVWRNVDLLDFAPDAGAKMHIKRGVLGNFFVTIGKDRAFRAMRLR